MAASAAKPRTSMQSLRLDLPPSCVEFCPAHPAYFLVGTYNLEKSENLASEDGEADVPKSESQVQTQSRNGSVIVFQLVDKVM
jgi:diphthamide biosynthesis protein 7